MSEPGTTPRRGRPPRISRARIVETARAMDPDAITMQAVADALGVERQSLSYHVRDRDELLSLVAADEIRERARDLAPTTPGDDWRSASWAFATGVRDALIATGSLSRHLRPGSIEALTLFEPVEHLLAAFFARGLDERTAVAAIGTLAALAIGAGQSAIVDGAGTPAEIAAIERDILALPPDRLPALHRAAAAHAQLLPDEQFAFDLDVLLRGLGTLIEDEADAQA